MLRDKIKQFFIGKPHNLLDKNTYQSIALIALFAWIGLGSDALSSSAYGPANAFLSLGSHTYLIPIVGLITVVTIFFITSSYSQIVEKFPTGGGGYLVATKLLTPTLGMISGCALLIDYVLTITISIASGADAIFSFLPASWISYKLAFAIAVVIVLTLLNLRGVKESVFALMPIFLLFILSHVIAIVYAIVSHFGNLAGIAASAATDFRAATVQLGFVGVFLLLLKAYSMGAGTYTGIESVSNGINSLKEPRVQTAKKTLRYIALSLSFMVLGLVLVYLIYGATSQPGKSLNAVAYGLITASWGNFGLPFVLVLLISEAGLLFVAAQTGFMGGPRVLANMALDNWFPISFSALSDRLVIERGILIMGGAAIAMMLITGGSVSFIIVLYSITVFITFVLSQLGMALYWLKSKEQGWLRKFTVIGIGTLLTAFILICLIAVNFNTGGLVTLLTLALLVLFVVSVKRHYNNTHLLTKRLDALIPSEKSDSYAYFIPRGNSANLNPHAKTAVLLVNGFNGIGIYAISQIFKLFGDTFRNFVFVEIGIIDAGSFKGAEEMEAINAKIKKGTESYVKLMERHGYYAKAYTGLGIEAVQEIVKMVPTIRKDFPNTVFFGGQLMFKNDSFYTRMLHNYTVFSLQKKLFDLGIPFVIVPIRV
jgi:amino acid transporter